MHYTYKNCKVLLDNNEFLVNEAQATLQSAVEPSYTAQERQSFYYAPVNGVGGALRLNYHLTGEDYLKKYLNNSTGNISGNFGGFSFKSGWLKSYQANALPHTPVVVSAEIVFFDEFKGVFSPSYERINSNVPVLHGADILVEDLRSGELGNLESINSFSYSFSNDIQPVYNYGESIPSRVVFGPTEVVAEVETDSLSGAMSLSGINCAVKFKFWNPSYSDYLEYYSISGVLVQRNFNTSVGQRLRSVLSVRQNNTLEPPELHLIAPTSGTYGDIVYIYGKNLAQTLDVTFNGAIKAESFEVLGDSKVKVVLPKGFSRGVLRVSNYSATVYSAASFALLSPSIYVSGVPITGDIGANIMVSGESFYSISDVLFSGSTGSNFRVISENLIQVTVPHDAAFGRLSVGSFSRGVTGYSATSFAPTPKITGFSPVSGLPSSGVVISGQGFSGALKVTFNDIPVGDSAAFIVNSNTQITAQVPTGNVGGRIKVYSYFTGVGVSASDFHPLARVTGTNATAGKTGKAISLFGDNFIADILYPATGGSNRYYVDFNGATGVFELISSQHLSGNVPSFATTGPVYVLNDDGGAFPSTVSYTVHRDAPILSGLAYTGAPGTYLQVSGSNFFNVTGARVSLSNVVTDVSVSASSLGDYVSILIPHVTGGRYDVQINTDWGTTSGGAIQILATGSISAIPISGVAGSRVWISGENLYDNSRVYFNNTGISATIVGYSSHTTYSGIEVIVPENISRNSYILVDNGVSLLTSSSTMSFVGKPVISGVTPTSGEWGGEVTISGKFLDYLTGLKFNDLYVPNTRVGTTGLRFNIPVSSVIDYVTAYNHAGYTVSSGRLNSITPHLVITGFGPASGGIGDVVRITGAYMFAVSEIKFSGESAVLNYIKPEFTGVANNVISFSVPPGMTTSKFTLVTNRGEYQTASNFEVIVPPSISRLVTTGAAYGQWVHLSGSGLSNGADFFFSGPTGNLVRALSYSLIGSTGAYVRVPREIVSGPVYISGLGSIRGGSPQNFIPFPTIFGATPTGITTGQLLILSGINALEFASSSLFFTGDGVFGNISLRDFSGDFRQITGQGITDNTTGYAKISGIVGAGFTGSGNPLLLPAEFNSITSQSQLRESYIYPLITGIINNSIVLRVSHSAPSITSFSPTRGSSSVLVRVSGDSLEGITGAFIKNGTTLTAATIYNSGNKYYTEIYPPTSFTAASGQIVLRNAHGSGTSTNYFTLISAPVVSGFSPPYGYTGDAGVVITGSNFSTATGVYFGNNIATFATGWNGTSVILTANVPPVIENTPNGFYIRVLNEVGEGISATKFEVIEPSAEVTGDLTVQNLTVTNSLVSQSATRFNSLRVTGDLSNASVAVFNNVTISGNFVAKGGATLAATQITGDFSVRDNAVLNNLVVSGGITGHRDSVFKSVRTTGDFSNNSTSVFNIINISGDSTFSSVARFNSTTYFQDARTIAFEASGSSRVNNLQVTGDLSVKDDAVLNNLFVSGGITGNRYSSLEKLAVSDNFYNFNSAGLTNVVVSGKLTGIGDSRLGDLQVTGDLSMSGAAVLGSLTVSGNTNFIGSVTTTNDAYFASTFFTNANVSNRVNVSGDTNVFNLRATGDLSVKNNTVLNNLFVSGGLTGNGYSNLEKLAITNNLYSFNSAGFNNVIISGKLTGVGDSSLGNLRVSSDLSVGGTTALASLTVSGATNLIGAVTFTNAAYFASAFFTNVGVSNRINISGDANLFNLRVTGDLSVKNNSVLNNLFVSGGITGDRLSNLSSLSVTSSLYNHGYAGLTNVVVSGWFTGFGNSTLGNLRLTGDLSNNGSVAFNNLTVSGNLTTTNVVNFSDLRISNSLFVSGDSQLNNLRVTGDFSNSGTSSFGAVQISGGLSSVGDVVLFGESFYSESVNEFLGETSFFSSVYFDTAYFNSVRTISLEASGNSRVYNLQTTGDLSVKNDAVLNNLFISGGITGTRYSQLESLAVTNNFYNFNSAAFNNVIVSGNFTGVGLATFDVAETSTLTVNSFLYGHGINSFRTLVVTGLSTVGLLNVTGDLTGNRLNTFRDVITSGNFSGMGSVWASTLQVTGQITGDGDLFIKGVKLNQNMIVSFTRPTSYPYGVSNNDYLILVDSTQGRLINLPTAIGLSGKVMMIKDASGRASTGTIRIKPTGAQTLDGRTGYNLNVNYGGVFVVSDNVNWYIV
jgi:cytoskeletal protein CcmA (bactofilin family)